jgi:LysR family nitrogen assimilation transcriptional regulator
VRERGMTIRVAVGADGLVTTRALVSAGLGYTILPMSAIQRQLKLGQLSAVRLASLDIAWTMCLAERRDQRCARAVVALRELIQSGVRRMSGDDSWRPTVGLAPVGGAMIAL